jgi:pyrroline-5-carboxylate reductase
MNEAGAGPLLLIGAGRMGSALLKGWLAQGVAPDRIFVQEPSLAADVAALIRDAGIGTGTPPVLPAAPAVVVLAVKPQAMDDVLPPLGTLTSPDVLVISIAAGTTIANIARHFAPDTAIVRAMPNTPAAIGRGITALYANGFVLPEQQEACAALLGAVGETVWLANEAQMDAVTALSGSGPAYVFLLAECMANAGEAAGLAPDLAARLARATVSGAGELLYRSDLEPAELRRNVTSPGGTTAAALSVLIGDGQRGDSGPMQELLRKAIEAAARRSRELAGG